MPIINLGIGNFEQFHAFIYLTIKLRLSLCIGPGTILNSLKQNRKTLHNDANWSGLPGWPADMSTVDNFAALQASTDNSGIYQAFMAFDDLELSLLS